MKGIGVTVVAELEAVGVLVRVCIMERNTDNKVQVARLMECVTPGTVTSLASCHTDPSTQRFHCQASSILVSLILAAFTKVSTVHLSPPPLQFLFFCRAYL